MVLNVGHCTSFARPVVSGALLQGLGMLLFLLAAPAVLREEEVAGATEQQGAPLLVHITSQKKIVVRSRDSNL